MTFSSWLVYSRSYIQKDNRRNLNCYRGTWFTRMVEISFQVFLENWIVQIYAAQTRKKIGKFYTFQGARNHKDHSNLYNKTRHDRIYVPYSRPNGWTDYAEIYCGDWGVAGGWHRLKKFEIVFFKIFFYFFKIFFSTGNAGSFS